MFETKARILTCKSFDHHYNFRALFYFKYEKSTLNWIYLPFFLIFCYMITIFRILISLMVLFRMLQY